MSNKTNYEVTFQYDFDEDNPKKFSDTRIKRVMTAHEGSFVSDYADYGIKDMSFHISSTPETLKTIMETVLKDAERSDIRMTVFAKKKFDLVLFDISEVTDKEAFFNLLQENKSNLDYRKVNISSHNESEVSIELNQDADKNKSLNLAQSLVESMNVKNISLDTDSIEFMQKDNYKNKKKSSLDY